MNTLNFVSARIFRSTKSQFESLDNKMEVCSKLFNLPNIFHSQVFFNVFFLIQRFFIQSLVELFYCIDLINYIY